MINKVIQGDCLDVMKDIPDKSVDCIFTSPPYNFGGFNRDGRKSKYLSHNDNQEDTLYKSWIKSVLIECSRVLKDGGVMFWNHKGKYKNWVYYPPYWIVDLCPIQLFQDIVWKYPSSPDVAKVKFYPRIEYIFMFSKGKPKYFNPDFAKLTNVWELNHSMGKIKGHPAVFTDELVSRGVESVTKEGDTVLDPFAGSGTTGVACKNLGRNYILIEKEQEYIDIINKRLQ
jgi:DNA modification methylase